MALYSVSQRVMVARAAGFQGDALVTAVAVSLAENSPGDTGKVNSIGCVGLWQINSRVHKQWTVAQLKDAATNARAAYQLSNGGTNWQPWEAYTGPDGKGSDGPWRKHAATALKAVQTAGGTGTATQAGFWDWLTSPDPWNLVPDDQEHLLPDDIGGSEDPLGGGLSTGVSGIAGSLAAIARALAAASDWLGDKDHWMRIAQVALGGGLLVVGLNIAVRPMLAPAVGAVSSVLPSGAIKKVVGK